GVATIAEDDLIRHSEAPATVRRPEVELGIQAAAVSVGPAVVRETTEAFECLDLVHCGRMLDNVPERPTYRHARPAIRRTCPPPGLSGPDVRRTQERVGTKRTGPAAEDLSARQAEHVATRVQAVREADVVAVLHSNEPRLQVRNHVVERAVGPDVFP